MNKNELITIVAEDTNLNKVEVAHAVEATFSAITHELAIGGDVRLLGFGSFTGAMSSAREGINPRTGEKVMIAAKRRARFKEGKALKEALNPVRMTGARRRVG